MEPDYEKARQAAVSLLMGQRLCTLQIDVTRLQYRQHILFDSMQHFCSVTRMTMSQLSDGTDCLKDGCTLRRRREEDLSYIVLYNQDKNQRRQSFTLAHEVGHILLDHRVDEDLQEREANYFAAQLLAPRILVDAMARRYYGGLCPEDLCHVFSLSHLAAEYRIADWRKFDHNAEFSPQERALLAKYRHLLPHPEEPHISV